jgi:hypothetical protein
VAKYVGTCGCGDIHGMHRKVTRTYQCKKCRKIISFRLR